MVRDKRVKKRENSLNFYAVKVQKSAEHYTEAAMDEVELLDCVAKERKKVETQFAKSPTSKDKDGITVFAIIDHSKHVATLHDSFFHSGPNGRHMCMVFSMLGCNLLSVIKAYNYRGIPIPVVKKMVKGVAKGLDFLHRKCQIIHTDLKPENVLLQFPSQINTCDEDNIDDTEDESESTITIAELESQLQRTNLSAGEKNRLKKKIKKRRQKEKHLGIHDEDGVGNNLMSNPTSSLFKQNNEAVTKNAHERVISRLSHSAFVTNNFSDRVSTEATHSLDEMVRVTRPSKYELATHFQLCSAQVGNKTGVAEVSFILRAFVTEGEIADTISEALSGIPWENSEDENSTREW